jgi:hypothetical protein
MDQPQRTRSDQRYIDSAGFEVYMIAGLVWLACTSLVFVLSVVTHHEAWVWPGWILSAVVGGVVLRFLLRRERLAKIREVDDE